MILKHFFVRVLLVTEPYIKLSDRTDYYLSIIFRLAPIAFLLNIVSWWFNENKQFGQFMCIALTVNMIIGGVFHFKNKTFSWLAFFKRNMLMVGAVSVVYVMLEMLRYTAGDNIAGELFKIMIQITTLLYPTSKVLKNIYIMSNGKYPPEFVMKKLYDFEKNGDLKAFFETKSKGE